LLAGKLTVLTESYRDLFNFRLCRVNDRSRPGTEVHAGKRVAPLHLAGVGGKRVLTNGNFTAAQFNFRQMVIMAGCIAPLERAAMRLWQASLPPQNQCFPSPPSQRGAQVSTNAYPTMRTSLQAKPLLTATV
jgi:hypothetical protein